MTQPGTGVARLDPAAFDWSSGEGGAAAVRRIIESAAAADDKPPLDDAALLSLRHHGLDTGLLLTGRLEGTDPADGHDADVQGFAYLRGLHGPGRPQLDLLVAPESRGRGLGTILGEAVVALADGIPLTAWSHGDHPAARALAQRLGFTAVRELWLMRRPLDKPMTVPPLPEGAVLRAFQPGEDDAGFLTVNAAAFAWHPEQGALDQRGLDDRKDEDWFDPVGFLVLERHGSIGGYHWTKVHPAAAGRPAFGEVYVIGIDPAVQGTGAGKALLVAGLEHLRSRGLREVVLYVEADNQTAIRLYESYGFSHDARDTDVMYASA